MREQAVEVVAAVVVELVERLCPARPDVEGDQGRPVRCRRAVRGGDQSQSPTVGCPRQVAQDRRHQLRPGLRTLPVDQHRITTSPVQEVESRLVRDVLAAGLPGAREGADGEPAAVRGPLQVRDAPALPRHAREVDLVAHHAVEAPHLGGARLSLALRDQRRDLVSPRSERVQIVALVGTVDLCDRRVLTWREDVDVLGVVRVSPCLGEEEPPGVLVERRPGGIGLRARLRQRDDLGDRRPALVDREPEHDDAVALPWQQVLDRPLVRRLRSPVGAVEHQHTGPHHPGDQHRDAGHAGGVAAAVVATQSGEPGLDVDRRRRPQALGSHSCPGLEAHDPASSAVGACAGSSVRPSSRTSRARARVRCCLTDPSLISSVRAMSATSSW